MMTPIVLVTSDVETEKVVAAALATMARAVSTTTCRSLEDLTGRLKEGPVAIAMVDIENRPREALKQLEPIIGKFPDTRFVAIAGDSQGELMLEAMQVGARHFMVKKTLAADIPQVVRRLAATGSVKIQGPGLAVTILSAAGGCGATTIAVNIANELGLLTSEPALLMDLDYCHGAIATYLGIEGRYSLADVLVDGSRIDPQLIRSTATAYSDTLEVLLSPSDIEPFKPAVLHQQHLGAALEACKYAYAYTVIDAPRALTDLVADLAAASAATLIVFQLTIKDLRAARVLQAALRSRGVPDDAIFLVANRCRKQKWMIGMEDAQKALGHDAITQLGNDFQAAVRSLNYGQPLAQVAPRSVLRKDLRDLAMRICRMQPGASHLPPEA